jgi:hypothetical protein
MSWDIFYNTNLSVKDQVTLLAPLLEQWIGPDYLRYYKEDMRWFYYNPQEKFSISIGRNSAYNKSNEDKDLFQFEISSIDINNLLTEDEHTDRVTAALALLWASNIPTYLPNWYREKMGYEDDYNGPVSWVEVQ